MAKFSNTSYVDSTGRIQRVVTSPEEAERVEAEGFTKGELQGPNREPLNAGREGNKRAAESSTTRRLNDGVDRPATSNA